MYKVILAFRYLFKKRISYLALLAVALCVFIVVVVMTVMTGLVTDFKHNNHKFVGDCVVGTESLVGFAYYEDFVKILEAANFIEAVSPVIKSFALVSAPGSQSGAGLEIMGIDPVRHSRATAFGKTLYWRKDNVSKAFEPAYDPTLPGCVTGVDLKLARNIKGFYSYGSSPDQSGLVVSCFPLTAKGALAKAGAGLVNSKTFYYSDYSHSGLVRVDNSMLYLPFEEAQLLCGMAGPDKRICRLHIKFKPNVKLDVGCNSVDSLWQRFIKERSGDRRAGLLKNVTVQSWKTYRRGPIAAMEKEQVMMTVMFGLVGLTVVFIVFVVFYMIISHKSKDIGILKSIGVSNADLMGLFSGFAFLIAVLGCCVGVVGGWLFLLKINDIEGWLFEHFGFQLWDRTIYPGIDDIPNQAEFKVLVLIVISAIAACVIGALVPSWRAMRLEPAETLQVNQLL
jgi:lipoprotein-releasing system permease protein